MKLFQKIKRFFTRTIYGEEVRFVPDFQGIHLKITHEGYSDGRGDTITKTKVSRLSEDTNLPPFDGISF